MDYLWWEGGQRIVHQYKICYYANMHWRIQRQLIVLIIILLPLAVLGFYFISKFLPEATCSDNKQNQGEIGIDCGGPCIHCALKKPKPITVFWTRAVNVRQNAYDVAAFIENMNEILATRSLEYEFTLFDDLGLVARRTGHVFLYPQERAYVIEPNIQTAREPTKVEFKVVRALWEVRDESPPNIIVERSNYSLSDESGVRGGVVEADVMNRTSFDFKYVEIQFVVLDAAENLLGVNTITIDNVRSAARRTVRSRWPGELKGDIARIEVKPRVNLFDPTVIVKPQ